MFLHIQLNFTNSDKLFSDLTNLKLELDEDEDEEKVGEGVGIVNIIDFFSYYDDVRTELKIIVYLQFRIYGNGHK